MRTAKEDEFLRIAWARREARLAEKQATKDRVTMAEEGKKSLLRYCLMPLVIAFPGFILATLLAGGLGFYLWIGLLPTVILPLWSGILAWKFVHSQPSRHFMVKFCTWIGVTLVVVAANVALFFVIVLMYGFLSTLTGSL